MRTRFPAELLLVVTTLLAAEAGFLEASDSRIAPVWLYWLTLYRGLALFVAILLECVETSLTASVFSIDGGRGFTRRVTFLLDPRHFNQ